MNFLEVTGKTIEEALNKALNELNVTKEDVEVEVLEEPSRGFLGIIGNKLGKIRVTLKDRSEEIARNFIQDILDSMNINGEIEISKENNDLNINLKGEESTALIGRRGDTLDSLQFLTGLVVNKSAKGKVRVLIDIENYRQKRQQSLIRYAKKLAKDVVRNKKTIRLEAMNPYERRIIHSALQRDPYVTTHSEGVDPNRKVVITLKNK
ncbi:RNA-binding cell elongation regulator Jag/EloR [Tepidibacter formicigenes]|jgi:spoIIIJ-associated protein|uniref:RNA-binding protein KhpB n=1 Tax=Tepidibacter formicigenes DSM 15518 TaxID=1123349 RepID=A0A1M6P8E0_9FIRM|nr:RNA-binding cell elongation regulator Jag/EloR [Tepidibacter formicigenes]SHK04228.1 spoIIIJ-associated protein [Tepidibacter formicigenes DSM 15518]